MSGETIERGRLPDGTRYRIWRRFRDGKLFGFAERPNGSEARRSVRTIRKYLREPGRTPAGPEHGGCAAGGVAPAGAPEGPA